MTTYRIKTIIDPDGTSTYAEGVNDSGVITGRFNNASGDHGFIYNQGVFITLDAPATNYTEGVAINNAGQVAGVYLAGSTFAGFLYDHGVYTTITPPGGGGLIVR